MMKKRLVILLLFLLALTGCGKETPEDVLQKAYKKQENVRSFTLSGTMELDMGTKIPVDMRVLVDRNDLDTEDDDEAYLDIDMRALMEDLVMKIWIEDGMIYSDIAGERQKERIEGDLNQETGLLTGQLNAEELLKMAKSSSLTKENGKKTVTLTFDEDMDMIHLDEIVLTVGSNGLIEHEVMTGSIVLEGESYPMKADLVLTGFDKTELPVLDKELFTTDTVDGPTDEDTYIDILFEDGLEIMLLLDAYSPYTIYYDEEGYILIYYNETDVIAEGYFMNGDHALELTDQVRNGENGYELIAETDKGFFTEGTREVIGYAAQETDDFYEGETFLITSFGDKDVGIAMWSYTSQENFLEMTECLSYLLIVDGE